MQLSTPIEELPRVGPQYQRKLKKLGIKTVRDALFHFPHRYEDFSNLIPIAKAVEGGPFCFQGKITDIKNIRTFRKRMILTQAVIEDKTGKMKALWFNQHYLINTFKKGDYVCLAGKVAVKGNAKYLSSPAYEKIPSFAKASEGKTQGFQNKELIHTGRLIPVYPETEGLSSKWLRFIVKPLLEKAIRQPADQIPDSLPEKIKKENNFLPLKKALWQIHFPDSLELAKEAKRRFIFEELFILSLFVLRERMKLNREKAIAIPVNLPLIKKFTEGLPYKLTDAQRKSVWQILKDLEKPRPMNRLLEGDVGSGKTVVATISTLNVAKYGYQTAFLAPTEILAKQHYKTITNLLKKFNVSVGLITGKESYYKNKKTPRKELLEKVEENKIDILIGTHAIIQDTNPKTKYKTPVKFSNLAFVIIDEQHRFGVDQRAQLFKQKEFVPHLLSMTATPIPRTLSLTIYGDLDLSIIDEMPQGRKKIITRVIQPKDKKETYDFIRSQVKEGRQAFVICPRIEPPTTFQNNNSNQTEITKSGGGQARLLDERNFSWQDVKAVKQEYEKLRKEIFPDLKIGMLHGKMKTQEKERIMKKFKSGLIDVLVSTSVVEVGVDIPNATVMMIEGSEKFGLAQLHQFRGRVGRSKFQSYCFLFTDKPGLITNRRLRALLSCENGFELAEKDLEIRGPGDLTGTRQWGVPDLVMSSLRDISLVEKSRSKAKEILREDPTLKKHPLLKENLEEFRKRIHFE